MRPEPRPELAQMPEAIHGALDFAELERLGVAPEAVLDFSVNGNPYGPSPLVREALARIPYERYPDRDALALRRLLATQLQVPLEQLLVGNGSMELLWLVALSFLRPGDAVLLLGPTFGEYQRVAMLMGARLHQCTAQAAEHFRIIPERVQQALETLQPRLVFLCNPNNPTGTFMPPEQIASWARAFPGTLFVVDEAYLTFVQQAPSVLTVLQPNMLLLRSMTKAYALAGLRLGYAIASAEILSALRQASPPWSVNALAQAAGIAALQDTAHLEACLTRITEAYADLVAGLRQCGGCPLPSTTHYCLLPVAQASLCRQALLRYGLQVRDCTSFGLPTYIRIATRRPSENARLLAALEELRPWPGFC
ncbi:MAG: histidinol-phosphate transaminase [Candidatus Tectimicrobiota bacterium]